MEKMIEERDRELPELISRGTEPQVILLKSDGTMKLKKFKEKS